MKLDGSGMIDWISEVPQDMTIASRKKKSL
jgi:hypothetical protein